MHAFRRSMPPRTLALLALVAIGAFVDGAILLLLLLSSSAQEASWWVTGIVLANLLPPVLLAPALGWVVDRIPGRLAWAGGFGVSGASTIGLALVDAPAASVALAGVQATCAVAVSATQFKLLPAAPGLTERRAASLVVTLAAVAGIVAPPVAALMSGIGIRAALVVCGALFVLCAVSVGLLVPGTGRAAVQRSSWHEIWLGTRSLGHMRSFAGFVPVMGAIVVATSMEGVAGVFYLQDVAGGAVGYGLILAAWAVGSLAGSSMTLLPGFRLGPGASVLLGAIGISAALLFEGLVPIAVPILLAFLVGGVANSVHNIGVRNLVYDTVPEELQGQAWAVVGALFSSGAALGNLLGTPGLLAQERALVIASGALGLGVAVVSAAVIALLHRRRGG
ncbi:MFS transporter [Gulosibacter sp. 10]|uniref:MFS transporter n=1 Tax=Gulosibacter sp. 10 TaxID=1255570 RepID=UPI00111D8052|nr:MFS transporter [Gulosibacter sp. 10]